MDNFKVSVLKYLNNLAKGHENAVTKAQIAFFVSFDIDANVDTRMVEEAIYSLRNDDMEPIGSSGEGYFIITAREERQRCVMSLRRRALKQLLTASRLDRGENLDPEGRQQLLDLLTGS